MDLDGFSDLRDGFSDLRDGFGDLREGEEANIVADPSPHPKHELPQTTGM